MTETGNSISAQFYDHLLQDIADGLLVLDQHGMVTSANQAAGAILGYEPDALIGHHYGMFWPEDSPPVEALDESESETEKNRADLRHSSGRSVPVSLSVSSIPAENSRAHLLSISETSDIRRLSDVLSHTQKLAGIGTLTASVAHELNTPISVITATCGNLLHEVASEGLSEARLLHYVKMIEQNAWRCAQILGALRNYTVEDSLQMAVTDLNMIIEDAVTLVRHQFQSDFNVNVEVDLQPDLKSIVCDHNRITQVLINLLTNARDAMLPDGGTILLRSWLIPAEGTPTEGSVPQDGVCFSVRDSGCGIASEDVEKIFRPFFTTKPDGKGSGLGLFVAKRIVTQHHGRIWAENDPEGGAVFTVVLPRRQPPVMLE